MIFRENLGAAEYGGDLYPIGGDPSEELNAQSDTYVPPPEVEYGDNEALTSHEAGTETITFNEDASTTSGDWPPDEPGAYESIIPPEDGTADATTPSTETGNDGAGDGNGDNIGMEAADEDDWREVRHHVVADAYQILGGIDMVALEEREADAVGTGVSLLALAAAQDKDPELVHMLAETLDSVPTTGGWLPDLARIHYAEHVAGDEEAADRLTRLLEVEAMEVAYDEDSLYVEQPALKAVIRSYEEFDEDPRQLIEDHACLEGYKWQLRREHYNRELIKGQDRQDEERIQAVQESLRQNVDQFVADAERLPRGFVLDYAISALYDCQGDQERRNKVLEIYLRASGEEEQETISPEWYWHNLDNAVEIGHHLLDTVSRDELSQMIAVNRIDKVIRRQAETISNMGLQTPVSAEAIINWKARERAFLDIKPQIITDQIKIEVADYQQSGTVVTLDTLIHLQDRAMETAAKEFARKGTEGGDDRAKWVIDKMPSGRQLEAYAECWGVANDREQLRRLLATPVGVRDSDLVGAYLLAETNSLLFPEAPGTLDVDGLVNKIAPLLGKFIGGPHPGDIIVSGSTSGFYWKQMERVIKRLRQDAPESLPKAARNALELLRQAWPPFNSSLTMDPFYGMIQQHSNDPADFELVRQSILETEDPPVVKMNFLARLALAIGRKIEPEE